MKYLLYTDGGCSNGIGGCAFVILKNDLIVCRYCKKFTNTTNNRMELMAVIIGLESVKKISEVVIYTDSMYVIGCASLNWKRNKNIDLWNRYDKINHSVTFVHVKGHTGDIYNELCDFMVKSVLS